MCEKDSSKIIFNNSCNNFVLYIGRLENSDCLAYGNAEAAGRLRNSISYKNMDIRCLLVTYKREKVIKCDMGYEETKAYIEEYNSEKAREYINIYPYEGMSDIAIYDSQNDEKFWQQTDRENYIKISYFRKL